MPLDRKPDNEGERQFLRDLQASTDTGPIVEVGRRGVENQGREFDHSANAYFIDCEECGGRVAIHCGDCKVHITGCACSMADRVMDIKAENDKREAASRKLWTPHAK